MWASNGVQRSIFTFIIPTSNSHISILSISPSLLPRPLPINHLVLAAKQRNGLAGGAFAGGVGGVGGVGALGISPIQGGDCIGGVAVSEDADLDVAIAFMSAQAHLDVEVRAAGKESARTCRRWCQRRGR